MKEVYSYVFTTCVLTTSGVSLATDWTKTWNGHNTICITDSTKSPIHLHTDKDN